MKTSEEKSKEFLKRKRAKNRRFLKEKTDRILKKMRDKHVDKIDKAKLAAAEGGKRATEEPKKADKIKHGSRVEPVFFPGSTPIEQFRSNVIGSTLNPKLMVMRDQKELLVEEDPELLDDIYKSYIMESKYGSLDQKFTIRDKGDLAQTRLYFSGVGDCPRLIYFKFHMPHKARNYTVKGLILFADGNMHHRDIQRRLSENQKTRNPEGYLYIPEFDASGYYDDLYILEKSPDGTRKFEKCAILEIKTKLPYACERVAQRDYDQAQLYFYAAKFSERLKEKRILITGIRLLYKDRAVQTDDVYFAWIVRPDQRRQAQVLNYYRWLKINVVDGGYCPPHPYERSSVACQYCRYHNWCWKGYPDPRTVTVDLDSVIDPTVKVPADREILEGMALRFVELRDEIKEKEKERDHIALVFLNYFAQKKIAQFPISEKKALEPKVKTSTKFNNQALIKILGFEDFSKISNPSSKLISQAIKAGSIDAGTVEKSKLFTASKPYVAIVNIKPLSKKTPPPMERPVKKGK